MAMLKKHVILLGILLSLLLLFIATAQYPGGTDFDPNTVGFSWTKNYISNLFGERAVNGAVNNARFWAMAGMVILSMSFALFFVQFSKRIPQKGAANVVKYLGCLAMLFTFLIATPLHDLMVTISSTIYLVCMFYITVFVFRSKLHLFKLFCTIYLLTFYCVMYIYGSGNFREYLPILQKILFAFTTVLILGLHYFTNEIDFNSNKKI